jgi:hypothetical protein
MDQIVVGSYLVQAGGMHSYIRSQIHKAEADSASMLQLYFRRAGVGRWTASGRFGIVYTSSHETAT